MRTTQDYLTDQTIRISVDHTTFLKRRIRVEIPPRSALSSALYKIYTTDIPKGTKHTKTCIYADDTPKAASSTKYLQQEIDRRYGEMDKKVNNQD